MPETFDGTVSFRNSSGETIVIIDPDAVPSPIILQDALGNRLLEITTEADILLGGAGFGGDISLRLGDGSPTIHLAAERATIDAGGNTQNGLLLLREAGGNLTVSLEGETGRLRLIRDGSDTIQLNSQSGDMVAGGNGVNGDLVLHRSSATDLEDYSLAAVRINASTGTIDFRNPQGLTTLRLQGGAGNLRAGGIPGVDGDLVLFRGEEGIDINDDSQSAIHANGGTATIDFRDTNGNLTVRLQGNNGNLRLGGGPNADGDLLLFRHGEGIDINDAAQAAIHADADTSQINFRDADGNYTARLRGDIGNLLLGGAPNADGDLLLFRRGANIDINDAAQAAIVADADTGQISFRDADGNYTVRIQGDSGNLRLGGAPNADGDLLLFRSGVNVNINDADQAAISANAGNARLDFRDANNRVSMRLEGQAGNIRLGGTPDADGDLLLYRQGSGIDISDAAQAAIHADAANASINFRDSGGRIGLRLEGDAGNIRLGGTPNADGDLALFRSGNNIDIFDAGQAAIYADADNTSLTFRDTAGRHTIRILGESGNIRCGGTPDVDGDILLYPSGSNIDINDDSQATIHLNGNTGDIILRNADCAEEFCVAQTEEVRAGMVMVLDGAGLLQPSHTAYDKRVVGVVSGAGQYRPGIVLDKQHGQAHRQPVALVGKVFCQVTAETSPIEVGDLLTTSDLPGYAMKASDPLQAFGAVIGKAMQPLADGRGLIPILIALQ